MLQEIPGLTDTSVPSRKGPKRASNIRKLFNLAKDDDVRRYVIKRPLPVKEGKPKRSKVYFKHCSELRFGDSEDFNAISNFNGVLISLLDHMVYAYPTNV